MFEGIKRFIAKYSYNPDAEEIKMRILVAGAGCAIKPDPDGKIRVKVIRDDEDLVGEGDLANQPPQK